MLRKTLLTLLFTLLSCGNIALAGSTDNEKLSSNISEQSANECFEGFSRVMFSFNHGLDKIILKPIAKGYRTIPAPIRKGTGNVVGNLRSLLTLSNNILQADFKAAGNTAGRFVINSTVGILGIWDPAASFGLGKQGREDFGQTLGIWGNNTGCYFVLPILGPTTTRDAVGLVGNMFLDPIYHVTHNSETDFLIGNENYQEHNFYFYRGTDTVNFRSKNIESFDSLENNSIDLYASVKSVYLQDRFKKVNNTSSDTSAQTDSDWEEIDNQ